MVCFFRHNMTTIPIAKIRSMALADRKASRKAKLALRKSGKRSTKREAKAFTWVLKILKN